MTEVRHGNNKTHEFVGKPDPIYRRAQVRGVVLVSFVLLMCTGCMPQARKEAVTPDFFLICGELAKQLSVHIKGGEAGQLIMTTIVDVDNLANPSGLGRALSETLATTLFQKGYRVVELRKAGEIMVKKNGGEFILSRDVTTLATEQKASAILAGTYSVTPYTIIVNLRMLRVESNEVSSVAGVEIPRSKAIDQLLTLPGILEEPSLSAYERMGG